MSIWLIIYLIIHVLCIVPTYLSLRTLSNNFTNPKHTWTIEDRCVAVLISVAASTLLLGAIIVLSVFLLALFGIGYVLMWLSDKVDWDKPAKW